ncbi:MAG: cobalt-precorrin-5B (C(1))-methyltransferase [Mariprofundaceae bacterium]|nr:cobalt-precorrin-5B (C(1))-methyltransferase [Mariprofundaceae bacterium]
MKKKERGTRTGFSTGACSAAATRAAVESLLQGEVVASTSCLLPNRDLVDFVVHEAWLDGDCAHAVIIKDAGDDPDCTHGAHLTADVTLLRGQAGHLVLEGGEGVGIVTMAGLGLELNKAAINPVPRKNILENIRLVAEELLHEHGLEIVISVPNGAEMAKKTLNDRLGIIGGISILGTTGIVRPYSTAAFRASVVQGIEVAARQGQHSVVLTTGGRTEKFVMRELPQLESSCFVQMGDFLGPALDTAQAQGLKQIIIGGMVGKLTKIAQGEIITHARRNPVNMALLADMAKTIGASTKSVQQISAAQTARFAAECMAEEGLVEVFHMEIAKRAVDTLQSRYPSVFHIRVLVCDFDGVKLAEFG